VGGSPTGRVEFTCGAKEGAPRVQGRRQRGGKEKVKASARQTVSRAMSERGTGVSGIAQCLCRDVSRETGGSGWGLRKKKRMKKIGVDRGGKPVREVSGKPLRACKLVEGAGTKDYQKGR